MIHKLKPIRPRRIAAALAIGLAVAMPASPALAGGPSAGTLQRKLAHSSCHALDSLARSQAGSGPMLMPSYPTVGTNDSTLRALNDTAYVYDNAVAGIALIACGDPTQAQRIADALMMAPSQDPTYSDGRLRNAYKAGPVQGKVQLPGYWDASAGYWKQDAYQVSTATGNVAWAALLFLAVYRNTHDARYLQAAVQQLHWIDAHTYEAVAPAAYDGGYFGFANNQQKQTWKSTEHNLDIHAAATWALKDKPGDAVLTREAKTGKAFVDAMWDSPDDRFYIGTGSDGQSVDQQHSALDAEVWPLLAFAPLPPDWGNVWEWVNAHHRIGDGYGYGMDPKGVWTEGTAQAAAAMQATGHAVPAGLWQLLLSQRSSAGGLLYATPQQRISTNLAIGPTSTSADFYYYHLPHLGATAWAALATKGWNPFDGQPLNTGGSH